MWEHREPSVILASGDRVAIDVEGIKIMQAFRDCSLVDNPWNYTQTRRAATLGRGVRNEQEHVVVAKSP